MVSPESMISLFEDFRGNIGERVAYADCLPPVALKICGGSGRSTSTLAMDNQRSIRRCFRYFRLEPGVWNAQRVLDMTALMLRSATNIQHQAILIAGHECGHVVKFNRPDAR